MINTLETFKENEEEGPPLLDRKAGLYLKHVPGKGRGVFCLTDIAKDEILEIAPGIFLDVEETELADETRLVDYTFYTEDPDAEEEDEDPGIIGSNVIMGIMTFCNHGQVPNAIIEWDDDADAEEDEPTYFTLRATRDIPANTEICTTYGEGWFEERDTTPCG